MSSHLAHECVRRLPPWIFPKHGKHFTHRTVCALFALHPASVFGLINPVPYHSARTSAQARALADTSQSDLVRWLIWSNRPATGIAGNEAT